MTVCNSVGAYMNLQYIKICSYIIISKYVLIQVRTFKLYKYITLHLSIRTSTMVTFKGYLSTSTNALGPMPDISTINYEVELLLDNCDQVWQFREILILKY